MISFPAGFIVFRNSLKDPETVICGNKAWQPDGHSWFYYSGTLSCRLIHISLNKYNAHTEPLFKSLELLSIKHLFDLSCLKFVYKFKQGYLPNYFLTFKCIPRSSIHEHNTRYSSLIDAEGTGTVIAGNCIRHHCAKQHTQVYYW